MLSQYRYALGIPGEGLHFHVGGVAIVDVMLTVAGAAVIDAAIGDRIAHNHVTSFAIIIIALFILTIFVHWIFDVPTTFNVALGLTKPMGLIVS